MTNPNLPEQPQGTGPVQGEQPPFAPQQPYGQPSGSPAPSYPVQGQPPQPVYSAQGQTSQQQYPQYVPQQPAPALPQQGKRPARKPRQKTDANGVPYGVGPFTLREALFLEAVALVFVASFLPFLAGDYADVFGYASAWSPAGWLIIPAALLLVAAAALMVMRRLLPTWRLSVGSLSVDQFASVASVVTAGFYLGALFLIAGFPAWFGGGSDILEPGAGIFVGLVFSLVAVAVTTLAPVLPVFGAEIERRSEVSAHPLARPVSPVPRRPRAERPAPAPQQQTAYPDQLGMQMPEARPGEFAAYRRKGSPSGPLPVDDQTTSYPAAPVAPSVGAVAFQPARQQPAEQQRVEQEPVEQEPVEQAPVEQQPVEQAPVEQQPVEQQLVDTTSDEPTRTLPTDAAAEPQAVAPGFVATDVPAVDPQGVAAVPVDQFRNDEFRDDEDLDDGEVGGTPNTAEPAPRSAFSHVSARTAPGGASDAYGSGSEQPTAVFSTQPFWVYSPVPRPVVDEVSGATVFEIGPSAWALAIMDRGSELVLRHDDGRVGVLRNLEGITRG
ncbi:hypothetical protein [Mycetocola miduiensis]|uniref:Uncharacterized protein n=1 Tax=Mycetocola miduiensis TaxID=995034 RepID=A0A1I5A828_9MICO|nr:hypothetical protein [Mycetocola miduiensis]SFN58603.1 hypothetical protein SAMN05216219_1248 [Mycetocola miduiensis]